VPLTSNVPLDDYVLVDASILIAAFIPTHRRHQTVQRFLRHAGTQFRVGAAELFASDLAIEEAAHFLTNTLLQDDVDRNRYPLARRRFDEWRQYSNNPQALWNADALYKQEPQAIVPHVPQVARFISNVRAIPIQIVEPDMLIGAGFSLVERMRDNIRNYALRPADAYHTAVASAIGATMLVTLDRDWLRTQQDFTVVFG